MTKSLDKRLADAETVIVQLGKNCEWLKRELEKQTTYGDERLERTAKALGDAIEAHRSMTFRQRLRWLVRGV